MCSLDVVGATECRQWCANMDRSGCSVYLRRFRYSHVFIRAAVIKEIAITAFNHALNEYDIRNLANPFPFFLRNKDRLLTAVENFARILTVEEGDSSAINELIVGAVVDQNDSFRSQNRRRPWLDHARVEPARASRQHRGLGRFGPMNEVG